MSNIFCDLLKVLVGHNLEKCYHLYPCVQIDLAPNAQMQLLEKDCHSYTIIIEGTTANQMKMISSHNSAHINWNNEDILKWIKLNLRLYCLMFVLKWFLVHAVHSQEFVCVFCFASCKTSQNVNILQLLTWSKFKVSKPPLCLWMWSTRSFEALCFVLSHITWWNNFAALKSNEASKTRHVGRNE